MDGRIGCKELTNRSTKDRDLWGAMSTKVLKGQIEEEQPLQSNRSKDTQMYASVESSLRHFVVCNVKMP